jgi:hypothetical protein
LVKQLSPVRLKLHNDVPFVRAVGALETAAFHSQSVLLGQHWPQVCGSALIDLPDCNHYTACEALAAPTSALFRAVGDLLSNG